jgi:hypothetical protein
MSAAGDEWSLTSGSRLRIGAMVKSPRRVREASAKAAIRKGSAFNSWMPLHLKPREPRHKVLIKARVRTASAWSDACILNVSSQGLSLQVVNPPPRGSYLEVWRGRNVIVARVIWTSHHRIGLHSQERLAVSDFVHQTELMPAGPISANGPASVERRSTRRSPEQTYEDNRWRSRAIQFGVVILFGTSAATIAYHAVGQAFAAALTDVRTALNAE